MARMRSRRTKLREQESLYIEASQSAPEPFQSIPPLLPAAIERTPPPARGRSGPFQNSPAPSRRPGLKSDVREISAQQGWSVWPLGLVLIAGLSMIIGAGLLVLSYLPWDDDRPSHQEADATIHQSVFSGQPRRLLPANQVIAIKDADPASPATPTPAPESVTGTVTLVAKGSSVLIFWSSAKSAHLRCEVALSSTPALSGLQPPFAVGSTGGNRVVPAVAGMGVQYRAVKTCPTSSGEQSALSNTVTP